MKTEIPGFLENVVSTNYGQKALISYITPPFADSNHPLVHGNVLESRAMATILSELGFDVDVVHYSLNIATDYTKYKLLIGFGYPYENSFKHQFPGKRIFYATGAFSSQRNPAELFRLRRLRRRRGTLLAPRRLKTFPDYASAVLSEAIFCTGNEWTIATYREVFDGPIYQIPVSAFSFYPKPKISRNIEEAKKSFVWFGGAGLVLKGLDLCMESFAHCQDLELNICGPYEDDFFELYNYELEKCHNITYHGFVDVRSDKFKQIVEKSLFTICPSSSEAGGASVLTTMASGMIPIVTRESSVNINGFGFEISDPEIETISDVINQASEINKAELEKRSQLSYNFIMQNHTLDMFKERFRKSLKEVLE